MILVRDICSYWKLFPNPFSPHLIKIYSKCSLLKQLCKQEHLRRSERRKRSLHLHSLQTWASAEIIRGREIFGLCKLPSTIAEQNNKENVCETKARDPHGAWVSASCHQYSCGVSNDKTQKVVLSPCLSRYTLITAAACLCAYVCVCVC